MRHLVVFFLIVLCAGWCDPAICSPFQKPEVTEVRDSGFQFGNRVKNWLGCVQQDLRRAITSLVREVRQAGSFLTFLLIGGGSLLYGMVHAAGPGHGKLIVMSYMLYQDRPRLMKGVLAGFIIAFGEALSAILVVYAVYYLALGRISSSFRHAERIVQVISYSIILILGLVLFFYRLLKLKRPSESRADAAQGGQKQGILLPVLLGLVPCPGVMLLLVFMLAAKMPLFGLLFAMCMASGMFLTISGFSILAVLMKSGAERLISGSSTGLRRFQASVELAGALFIVLGAAAILVLL